MIKRPKPPITPIKPKAPERPSFAEVKKRVAEEFLERPEVSNELEWRAAAQESLRDLNPDDPLFARKEKLVKKILQGADIHKTVQGQLDYYQRVYKDAKRDLGSARYHVDQVRHALVEMTKQHGIKKAMKLPDYQVKDIQFKNLRQTIESSFKKIEQIEPYVEYLDYLNSGFNVAVISQKYSYTPSLSEHRLKVIDTFGIQAYSKWLASTKAEIPIELTGKESSYRRAIVETVFRGFKDYNQANKYTFNKAIANFYNNYIATGRVTDINQIYSILQRIFEEEVIDEAQSEGDEDDISGISEEYLYAKYGIYNTRG